jgi:hypothetical protein
MEPVAVYALYRTDSYKAMGESVVTHKQMIFKLFDGKVTEQNPDNHYMTAHYLFNGEDQSEWVVGGRWYRPTERLTRSEARELWNSLVSCEWTRDEAREKVKV